MTGNAVAALGSGRATVSTGGGVTGMGTPESAPVPGTVPGAEAVPELPKTRCRRAAISTRLVVVELGAGSEAGGGITASSTASSGVVVMTLAGVGGALVRGSGWAEGDADGVPRIRWRKAVTEFVGGTALSGSTKGRESAAGFVGVGGGAAAGASGSVVWGSVSMEPGAVGEAVAAPVGGGTVMVATEASAGSGTAGSGTADGSGAIAELPTASTAGTPGSKAASGASPAGSAPAGSSATPTPVGAAAVTTDGSAGGAAGGAIVTAGEGVGAAGGAIAVEEGAPGGSVAIAEVATIAAVPVAGAIAVAGSTWGLPGGSWFKARGLPGREPTVPEAGGAIATTVWSGAAVAAGGKAAPWPGVWATVGTGV